MSGLELFVKGGPVMYLLLFCSGLVVYTFIERCLYYRANKTFEPEVFFLELESLLEQRAWEEAKECCKKHGGAMGEVALQGIEGAEKGKNIEIALEGATMLKGASLKSGLRYLNAVVTVAPLLGLLGTVIGMIHSFSIFSIESGQPMAITGGVGEALIATASGLLVAVVSFLMYLILSRWSEKLIIGMDRVSFWLMLHLTDENLDGEIV